MLEITGDNLSIKDIIKVSRNYEQIKLSPYAKERITEGFLNLQKIKSKTPTIYGISTGVGSMKDIYIPSLNREQYQKNILLSHAMGTGPYFDEDIVRAAILLKINSFAKGYSGVRLLVVESLIGLLNNNIVPAVPQKGSVGSSGDLVPLAHIALVIIGEGYVIEKNQIVDSKAILQLHKLYPISLVEKEGLSLINGTEMMTAIASLVCYDTDILLKTADIAGAMSFEVLNGVIDAYDLYAMNVRPHIGQLAVAKNLLSLLKGSFLEKKGQASIQDAYSLRCIPQVHGASRDALTHAINIVTTEINSVTDNPIFVNNCVFSNGNFHGQPIALVMDYLKIALSEIGNISERRINRMLDCNLSHLPPFLATHSQISPGLMIVQYSAAALVSENKVLAHPASVDSIPLSANQEDHVSMGTIAARQAKEILINVQDVISMELFISINGIEYFKHELGQGTQLTYDYLRQVSPQIEEDRLYIDDIKKITHAVVSGKLLEEVAKKIEIL